MMKHASALAALGAALSLAVGVPAANAAHFGGGHGGGHFGGGHFHGGHFHGGGWWGGPGIYLGDGYYDDYYDDYDCYWRHGRRICRY